MASLRDSNSPVRFYTSTVLHRYGLTVPRLSVIVFAVLTDTLRLANHDGTGLPLRCDIQIDERVAGGGAGLRD